MHHYHSYPTIHGCVLDIRHGLIRDLELPIAEWKDEGVVPAAYTANPDEI